MKRDSLVSFLFVASSVACSGSSPEKPDVAGGCTRGTILCQKKCVPPQDQRCTGYNLSFYPGGYYSANANQVSQLSAAAPFKKFPAQFIVSEVGALGKGETRITSIPWLPGGNLGDSRTWESNDFYMYGMGDLSGDVDGDGITDLLVFLQKSPPAPLLLKGLPDGTYVSGGEIHPSLSFWQMADLDQDGNIDLVGSLLDESPQLSVGIRMGMGDGSFASINKINFPDITLSENEKSTGGLFSIGNFEGDNKREILAFFPENLSWLA